MYAVVLTSLVSLNVSKNILPRFVKDEAGAARVVRYFEKQRAAIPDSLYAARIKTIATATDGVHALIVNIKTALIRQTVQVDEQTALQLMADPASMPAMDPAGFGKSFTAWGQWAKCSQITESGT